MKKVKNLVVETPIGKLIAEPSADPTHPGIVLGFQPEGSGCTIDLAYAEVPQDSGEKCCVYLWEELRDEDWTRKFSFSKKEALEALGED